MCGRLKPGQLLLQFIDVRDDAQKNCIGVLDEVGDLLAKRGR